jgi:hypothetical protein
MDPEGLLLFAKELITRPCPKPQTLPYGPTGYCPPIYAHVCQITFFFQIIWLKLYMNMFLSHNEPE